MKVLVVATQFPFPPRSGVNMRVYQLLRQLARRHAVTLLTYAGPDERESVEALRREMRVVTVERAPQSRRSRRLLQAVSLVFPTPFSVRDFHSRALQTAIDRLCAEDPFDIVQLESTVLCRLSVPAGPRVVLDEHNIEYEVFRRLAEGERSRLRRAFNRWEFVRVRRFEQRAWKRVHGCVVTSDREAPTVEQFAPGVPTAVVPNAVDLAYFQPSETPPDPDLVVFNGTLAYRPNVDAVEHLIEDVWPLVRAQRPQARLVIVGRASDADRQRLSGDGVAVTGEVPDIRPYIHDASVVVVPIRMGGGTRLKVVEGLAMAKPMVSTSLGCEGIAVRDGEHLLIGDDAVTFAAKVLQLLENPALGRNLGATGRRLAEERYSWDRAGDRLDHLYGVVARRADVPALQRAATSLPAADAR